MTKFRSICLVHEGGPGYRQCDMPPIDLETARDCSREFRERLLRPEASFRAPLEAESAPEGRVGVLWRRTGHTAGFALWFHGGAIAAVTLLLSGLDAEEDERAILTAAAIESLPFPEGAYEQVRAAGRPIHALLHCGREAAKDATVNTGSASLAAVFFSLLGTSVGET